MAAEYLERTPTSSGNRSVFTWSGWVKRNKVNQDYYLFSSGDDGNNIFYISIRRDANFNNLTVLFRDGDSTSHTLVFNNNSFRDPGSWMHFVVSVNTTIVDPKSDRCKVYINGARLTGWTTDQLANITQNGITSTNALGELHTIGDYSVSSSGYSDMQIFDYFLVDGQALTPDVFGFYKDGDGYMSSGTTNATDFRPGQWSPRAPRSIKYTINRSGGFGVNGYYLPMNDSSNPGADFHCDPNSIIKLKGEDLPQPRNGAPTTSDAFVSELRQETGTLGFDGVVAFDGTGDYLTPPSNTDFTLGTGDFTIECWVYPKTYGGIFQFFDSSVLGDSTSGPSIGIDVNDNSWAIRYGTSSTLDTDTIATLNMWYHIAYVRNSSVTKLYVNGKEIGSVSDSTDYSANYPVIGGWYNTSFLLNGFISNFRVVKGTALYTANFTAPTEPLTNVTNTKLLCCNSSTSAIAATVKPGDITANGNPFATRNELTGSIVLAVPGIALENTNTELVTNGTFDSDNSSWNGTGISETHNSFTTSQSGGYLILNSNTNSGSTYGVSQNVPTVNGTRYTLSFDIVGGTGNGRIRVENGSSGSNVRTTVNGLGVGSHSFSFIAGDQAVSRVFLGRDSSTNGGQNATVHYDNISVKEAIPERDYSADIKGSGTNKTFTAVGNAGASYGLGGYYGSAMTFDGSGDYFDTPESNNEYDLDGDYTIEFWVNFNSINNVNDIIGTANNSVFLGSGKSGWVVGYANFSNIGFRFGYQNNSSWIFEHHTGVATVANQWNHVAITRSGSTQQIIINGVVAYTETQANIITSTDNVLRVGGGFGSTSALINAQIQDLRIYKGVAKYKGGFDVPKPYIPVGIESWRTTADTCKNNFATLNPLASSADVTYSNGNLTSLHGSSATRGPSIATMGVSQAGTEKYYWEFRSSSTGSNNAMSGLLGLGPDITDGKYVGYTNGYGIGYYVTGETYIAYGGAITVASYGATYATGDIIGVSLDMETNNGSLTFYKNGVSQGVAATGLGAYLTSGAIQAWVPGFGDGSASQNVTHDVNFGQNPSFSGTTTAGTNADDSGKGLFKYAPPSGFLALCEDNLPTPAIADPGKHFKTVLYTGSSVSGSEKGRSVSGLGFKPDLVWLKSRSIVQNHQLYDSVRGFGGGKGLSADANRVEGDIGGFSDSDYGFVSSADDNGFSVLATHSTGTWVNNTGVTYVAWCWKAGGAAVSNTDGSITSQVSANQTAGFSIVSYTANQTPGATVGHGLGKTPKMVIVKQRTGNNNNWTVYHAGSGNTIAMYLDLPNANSDFLGAWNDTSPTSSVFSLGNSVETNRNSSPYIAYCWAEIEGFSKIGSYVGNSSDDGTFVYCGFKPAWVMIKVITTGTTNNWYIHDSSRNPTNPSNEYLMANENNDATVADHPLDMVSNGFKLRKGSYDGYNGNYTYIFAAFAESPFQTANAR